MPFLACLGASIVGLLLGAATVYIQYDFPLDEYIQLVLDRTEELLYTPLPYCLASIWTVVLRFLLFLRGYILKRMEKKTVIEFKLNNFLSVRFEYNISRIYVNNEPFKICKYLLMNIPTEEVYDYDSIDEASEYYSRQLEHELTPEQVGLSPEEEFKAHCSNLQVWVENNYDTCLLHRNLAFPLLKKLASVGDSVARGVFSQEILDRFRNGSTTVQTYLVKERYLHFLRDYKVEELFEYIVDKSVLYCLGWWYTYSSDLSSEIKVLNRLIEMDPINYRGHMVLANRYVKMSEILMTKLVLRKILLLYPGDEKSLFFLAHLYMFEGKIDKTKQTLNRLKDSEFKFVKYRNIPELDVGMHNLLAFIDYDFYPNPFKHISDLLFEDWS